MSRGLVLFLRSEIRETTLNPSHGVGAIEWKDQLSKGLRELPNLTIRLQNGSFTELQQATCNAELFSIYDRGGLKRTTRIGPIGEMIKPGTLLTVRDVISRIPDLRYLYEQTFENLSECYKSDIQLTGDVNNKSVRVSIIQRMNSGLLSFDQLTTNLRLPDELVPNNSVDEDKGEQVIRYSFDLTYQSEEELFKQLPAIQNDRNGSMFLVSPLPDGTRLSSTASLYIIAYAMSMLARYYPSTWLSIINRTRGDFAYPIMKAALSLVQGKFPELILQRLQHI
jgi:hypothetical protein